MKPTSSPLFPPTNEKLRKVKHAEARQYTKGHGRQESRHLEASTRIIPHLNWPGVKQVLKLTCIVNTQGKKTREVRYAITSLPPERASPSQLLRLWRGHWGIENRLHWVRDTEFREDHCQVRIGHGPHNLAAFRNTAISLLRLAGCQNIARSLRHFARRTGKLREFLTK